MKQHTSLETGTGGFGKISMSVDEVYAVGLALGLPDLGQSYYSPLFIQQLFVWNCRDDRVANAIVREVQSLEGLGPDTTTGPPRPFRKTPLKGLLHQHFLMPDAAVRNIGIEWALHKQGNRRLDDKLVGFFAQHEGKRVDEVIGELTHNLVMGGYEARCQERRMTGEWIIFGEADERRYYLALATHRQGREEPHSILAAVRRSSGSDYDFLIGAGSEGSECSEVGPPEMDGSDSNE